MHEVSPPRKRLFALLESQATPEGRGVRVRAFPTWESFMWLFSQRSIREASYAEEQLNGMKSNFKTCIW